MDSVQDKCDEADKLGVVCELACKKCENVYIGETRRKGRDQSKGEQGMSALARFGYEIDQ